MACALRDHRIRRAKTRSRRRGLRVAALRRRLGWWHRRWRPSRYVTDQIHRNWWHDRVGRVLRRDGGTRRSAVRRAPRWRIHCNYLVSWPRCTGQVPRWEGILCIPTLRQKMARVLLTPRLPHHPHARLGQPWRCEPTRRNRRERLRTAAPMDQLSRTLACP